MDVLKEAIEGGGGEVSVADIEVAGLLGCRIGRGEDTDAVTGGVEGAGEVGGVVAGAAGDECEHGEGGKGLWGDDVAFEGGVAGEGVGLGDGEGGAVEEAGDAVCGEGL